jgi:uncharacterized protein YeaO (DUF488 family)
MLPVPQPDVALKRIDGDPAATDGARFLVDRLWPNGVTEEHAALDGWLKELAPSTELRQWHGDDPARWEEFRRRYRVELRSQRPKIEPLRRLATRKRVTLLYSGRDPLRNSAQVLKSLVEAGSMKEVDHHETDRT